MCAKKIKPPQLELSVVLDTNALYTGSASYFVKKEVADLVEQQSAPDLKIKWIVPDTVRHERQFQMLQAAEQMLPTIERLEKLLGHNLNITPAILSDRVAAAVDHQVTQLGLSIQPLSVTDVDWQRLMRDAAYRKPPFETGEKEKGFRDSLILETFLQVVAATPVSRNIARAVLVSNDRLLRDAATSRIASAANVHILESIEALKGLINTLGSSVDEAFIASIRDRASDAFFTPQVESTLFYKASVSTGLKDCLKKAEIKLPPTAERYVIENWTVNHAQFAKKEGQRIFWTSRFEARLKAVKSPPQLQLSEPWQTVYPGGTTLKSLSSILTPPSPQLEWAYKDWTTYNVTGPVLGGEDQIVGHGTASLDAAWSLAVTTAGTLTKLKLESIDFVEVVWD
jgi:hypothetical protein